MEGLGQIIFFKKGSNHCFKKGMLETLIKYVASIHLQSFYPAYPCDYPDIYSDGSKNNVRDVTLDVDCDCC